MLTYFEVLVMFQYIRRVAIIIVTFDTTDCACVALLRGCMTLPARGRLIIVTDLLVTGGAITAVNFLQPGVTYITG